MHSLFLASVLKQYFNIRLAPFTPIIKGRTSGFIYLFAVINIIQKNWLIMLNLY